MANGVLAGAKAAQAEAEAQEKDIFTAFRTMLGEATEGKIQVWLKDKESRKYQYLYLRPFDTTDDTFRDQLRKEFVEGGDFKLVLTTQDAKYIGTEYLELAPLPASMRPRAASVETRARGGDDNNFMLALMKMSEDSSHRQMQMMMQMQDSQTKMMVAMFQAINKGGSESPSEMLKNLSIIQKDMKGDDTSVLFERFLGTLNAAKEFVSGGQAQAEGMGGI